MVSPTCAVGASHFGNATNYDTYLEAKKTSQDENATLAQQEEASAVVSTMEKEKTERLSARGAMFLSCSSPLMFLFMFMLLLLLLLPLVVVVIDVLLFFFFFVPHVFASLPRHQPEIPLPQPPSPQAVKSRQQWLAARESSGVVDCLSHVALTRYWFAALAV